ncbi:hypothetical protein FCM35_KLT00067 [Carex littledalei]|uniref:Uncharacterized protein n=1 Tax=Carex littledalei TaxID=544730 RepID=A0A833W2Y2_9POAL|nr:hypothetical protein FCM35_KLT00067 [Carex littledalei]
MLYFPEPGRRDDSVLQVGPDTRKKKNHEYWVQPDLFEALMGGLTTTIFRARSECCHEHDGTREMIGSIGCLPECQIGLYSQNGQSHLF